MSDKIMDKIKVYFPSIITIVLCGEMYFFPFQGAFRFSVGVVALSIILLFYEDIKEVYLSIFTSIAILLIRSFIHYFDGNYNIAQLFKLNMPAAFYYLVYGLLFYSFKIRNYSEFTARTIYLLTIIDASANILESLIRNALTTTLVRYIIIVAIARSIIIYVIYYLIKRKELLIKKIEHQKKYDQLNTLISSIQAEIFYLSKSTSDIENVMSKAYKLYESSKGNKNINNQALDIAREIHEIKKDFQRVVTSFKSYVDNFNFNKPMSLKDIGNIIKNNLDRYISYHDKDIDVRIKFYNNLYINNYFYLFTIINNLIVNAIDAISENGSIIVEGRTRENYFILTVKDDGMGIDDELQPYIFNPGFTTKFDSKSGTQSTGIGLSHVKYIVNSLEGEIQLESKKNQGTSFTITIPIENLRR
ncbi:MAG: sensor histidine kinase [Tissierellia bacterium]|nr:sensor histidine kinase [Tissierellia bacterium]